MAARRSFLLLPLLFASLAGASSSRGGGSTACVPATVGMSITADTTLCAGTLMANVSPGAAAITIDADGVTLTCAGTILQGSSTGDTMSPTVGIRIEGRKNVTVKGCTAKGFRY